MSLVAALVVAACGWAGSSSTSSRTGYTLRLGIIGSNPVPTGAEGWALHLPSLRQRLASLGITKVQVLPFGNGPDLIAAMTGGSVDVGILGDTPALVGKAHGLDTRLINIARGPQDAWLLAKKDGPRSVHDLRGKVVATQKGSYMYRYLVGLLQSEGLQGQVMVTNVLTPEAFAALQKGSIDAYAAPISNAAVWEEQGGFPIIDQASWHAGLQGTSVTIATARFLAAHPGFAPAWNRFRSLGVDDLQAHLDAYYGWEAQVNGESVEEARRGDPATQYHDQAFPQDLLQLLKGTDSFLVANHLSDGYVDIDRWRQTS